jgi:hypothetical protein
MASILSVAEELGMSVVGEPDLLQKPAIKPAETQVPPHFEPVPAAVQIAPPMAPAAAVPNPLASAPVPPVAPAPPMPAQV